MKKIITQQTENDVIYLYNHNDQGDYQLREEQLEIDLYNLDNGKTCMLCLLSSYNRFFRNRNISDLKYIGQYGSLEDAYKQIFVNYRGLSNIDVFIKNGQLYVTCYYHDGSDTFIIIQLDDKGAELLYNAQYNSDDIDDEDFNNLIDDLIKNFKVSIGQKLYRQSIKKDNVIPKKTLIRQSMDEQFKQNYVDKFTRDFSMADRFGEGAIEDTFKKAFYQYRYDYKYLTGLVIALNWKIWQHYQKGNRNLAGVYNELWKTADTYACDTLKQQELSDFYRLTD